MSRFGLRRTAFATPTEPVTLGEAKLHLRVDGSSDDTLIADLITASRAWCEEYTKRQFMAATWILSLDRFPGGWRGDGWASEGFSSRAGESQTIILPRPPLIDGSVAITYVDPGGVTRTLSPTLYVVDAAAEPARVAPVFGTIWPFTLPRPACVSVSYQSGLSDADDLPTPIKQAVLMMCGHLYINRETASPGVPVTKVPFATEVLLDPYRVLEAT